MPVCTAPLLFQLLLSSNMDKPLLGRTQRDSQTFRLAPFSDEGKHGKEVGNEPYRRGSLEKDW